jgi:HSP20 family protein
VRSFQIPAEVETDKVKANFKDGVLEIRMPKTQEAKQKEKKVAVG